MNTALPCVSSVTLGRFLGFSVFSSVKQRYSGRHPQPMEPLPKTQPKRSVLRWGNRRLLGFRWAECTRLRPPLCRVEAGLAWTQGHGGHLLDG